MDCPACAGTGVCDACSGYGYFPASPDNDHDRLDCAVCDGSTECADCSTCPECIHSTYHQDTRTGAPEMSHR